MSKLLNLLRNGAIFSLLICCAPVYGQFSKQHQGHPKGIQANNIVGEVTAVEGPIVQISGTVKLDLSSAFIDSISARAMGEHLDISSIKAGNFVTAVIKDSSDPSAPYQTEYIFINQENEGIFIGKLENIDLSNNTITVFNRQLQLNDKTSFVESYDYELKTAKRIDQLKIGREITVKYVNVNGAAIAIEIEQVIKHIEN